MYAFLLDRRSLSLLVAGSLFVGALLFAMGFALGLKQSLPSPEAVTAAESEPTSQRWQGLKKAVSEAVEDGVKLGLSGTEPGTPEETPGTNAPQGTDSPKKPAGADRSASAESLERPISRGSPPAASEPLAQAPIPAPSPAVAVLSSAITSASRTATPASHTSLAPRFAVGVITKFSVQVGAFSERENAQQLGQELRGLGYEPYLIPITLSSGRRLTSVRIGNYADAVEAQAVAEAYRATGNGDAVVRWRDVPISAGSSSLGS